MAQVRRLRREAVKVLLYTGENVAEVAQNLSKDATLTKMSGRPRNLALKFPDWDCVMVPGDYLVTWPSGAQQVWSQSDIDNLSDPHTGTFDFGVAVSLLKEGRYVARKGWNGKGMYLWLLPAAKIEAKWVKDPHLKALCEANGGEVDALGSIRMLTATGEILTGWLPSQTDVLSEDWVEVIPPVLQ